MLSAAGSADVSPRARSRRSALSTNRNGAMLAWKQKRTFDGDRVDVGVRVDLGACFMFCTAQTSPRARARGV
eukprot:8095399-Pyramimonas_sp.AAC.1